jgi:hypothetical protein
MDDIKLSTLKTLARKAFLLEALDNKKAVTWNSKDDDKTYNLFISRDAADSLYCHFPADEIGVVIEEFAYNRHADKQIHLTEDETMEYLANKKDAKKPKPAPRKPCKNDVKKYTPSLNGKGENLNVVV